MSLSIRWKVALSSLLALTLGLAVAGWLMLGSIEQLELARAEDALAARSSLTAQSLGPLLRQTTLNRPDLFATLQPAVRELGLQARVRVTVIGADGTVLADSAVPDHAVPTMENHLARPEVQQALAKGYGVDIRRSDTIGLQLFYFARTLVPADSSPTTVVRLALPLTTLEGRTREFKRALGIAFGLALVVSMALGILLARQITLPLSRMVAVARRLAGGALGERVRTAARDEVGVLASTLNQMAEQLETKIQEVSEDRAQLRAMLSSMVEGVMVLDCRGRILRLNPALEQMFMVKESEARGRAHSEVIRHHDLNELVKRTLESGHHDSGEITIVPSGRTLRVVASVAAFQRENEPCAVLVFHDITTLRKLEKIRKDFVANVSHELRTPLTSIKGYVEALLDGAKDNPRDAEHFLNIILKQSDRLNFILDDLLQLSKIESGEVMLARLPVDMHALVERVVAVIKPLADKHGHSLTILLPADIPPVPGDEERLGQVLTNLLDNAVKYTPPNGTIRIEGRRIGEGDHACMELAVADTGIGIPEADRPRIFERFYRVDKARSRELGGTGLGLSIVKHIVEGHNGQVWVEANRPRGSRFVVRLPLLDRLPAGA